ncbi:hypothetical protein ABW19_dt0201546 [Dactylella cylindrospora]|nr:hypothetical protein ABW19_dt0201546 [Dactylella cylindrospora]
MCFVRERTGLPVAKVWGFWLGDDGEARSIKSRSDKAPEGDTSMEMETGPATKNSGSRDKKRTNGGVNYMLIESLPGVPVNEAWSSMTSNARSRFRREFIGYIQELRSLEQPPLDIEYPTPTPPQQSHPSQSQSQLLSHSQPSPSSSSSLSTPIHPSQPPHEPYIGSLNHSPLTDHRIATIPYGPFPSIPSWLNCEYLLGYVLRARPPEVYNRLYSSLTRRGPSCRIVFTHSDLTPRNILVDGETGRITGIIDWDSAGWNVEWWEGVKGVYGWGFGGDRMSRSRRGTGISTGSDGGGEREEGKDGEGGELTIDVWKGMLKEAIGDFEEELKADEEVRDIYGFPY